MSLPSGNTGGSFGAAANLDAAKEDTDDRIPGGNPIISFPLGVGQYVNCIIDVLRRKLLHRIANLGIALRYVPTKYRLLLYNKSINSLFTYCCTYCLEQLYRNQEPKQ